MRSHAQLVSFSRPGSNVANRIISPPWVDLFRRNRWRVKVNPSVGRKEADLLVSSNSSRYLVELKVASEGRSDRLVPLLAQAILQARSVAEASTESAVPLAIVAAPTISTSVAKSLQDFLAENAPDCAAGIFDRKDD